MSSSETAAMADIAITHPYTCNTCQVAYRNIELQKGHMKSDWQYVFLRDCVPLARLGNI
jgi:pre-60S factor REI1